MKVLICKIVFLLVITVSFPILCLSACSAQEKKSTDENAATPPQVSQPVLEAMSSPEVADEEKALVETPSSENDSNPAPVNADEQAGDTVSGASETESNEAGNTADTEEHKFPKYEIVSKKIIEGPVEPAEIPDPSAFMPVLRPYAASPYAEQIDKGLAWIAANYGQQSCNWMDYGVLDYLQRKFGLDESLALAEIININEVDEDARVLMLLYAPLVREGYNLDEVQVRISKVSLFADYKPQENEEFITVNTLKHLGVSISGAMLRAIYCKQAAVDDDFVNELLRQIRETPFKGKPNSAGGYLVTHMILAYKWLKENGCAEAFESLTDADEEFAELLAAIAADQQVVTDLGMEAIAFLYYLGYPDRVNTEWIEAIAAAQMPEGSWDRHGGKKAGSVPQGHTTAFALWALLEHALPDVEEIPWLR